jgi:hypothetical protein
LANQATAAQPSYFDFDFVLLRVFLFAAKSKAAAAILTTCKRANLLELEEQSFFGFA